RGPRPVERTLRGIDGCVNVGARRVGDRREYIPRVRIHGVAAAVALGIDQLPADEHLVSRHAVLPVFAVQSCCRDDQAEGWSTSALKASSTAPYRASTTATMGRATCTSPVRPKRSSSSQRPDRPSAPKVALEPLRVWAARWIAAASP